MSHYDDETQYDMPKLGPLYPSTGARYDLNSERLHRWMKSDQRKSNRYLAGQFLLAIGLAVVSIVLFLMCMVYLGVL